MSIAACAQHFGAMFQQRIVGTGVHGIECGGRTETRPAGTGVELFIRTEEDRSATDAAIDAGRVMVPVAARVGDLGAAFPRNVEFLRRETALPFGLREDEFWAAGWWIGDRVFLAIEDRIQTEI